MGNIPLLVASVVAVIGALGSGQLWLWANHRNQPWLAYWGLGHLVGAAATLLYGGRGKLPDFVTIDIATASLTLGFALLHAGARAFEGRRVSPMLIVAGPVIWLLACQVDAFIASLETRVLLGSLLSVFYTAATGLEFLRPRPGPVLPSRRTLGWLVVATAVLLVLRGGLAFVLPLEARGQNLPQANWFAVIVLLHVAARVAGAILMVALAKEEAEARVTLALTRSRDAEIDANQQKTRFLTRMSHELRTPLNAVLGMAQVLVADDALDTDTRARAGLFEQGGRHLLAIVNDLLDLASLEAGRIVPVPEPFDLGPCLSGSMALLLAAATAKGLRLELSIGREVPGRVRADPRRLRQMLLNLLGNAVKFTPAGGTITLAATIDPGGSIRLSVTDTGPGVPPALRPRLFEDFARGAEMSDVEGSGLGLAITAALARAMGGRLDYTPGPEGRGSCFHLTLPLPAVA